MFKRFDLLLVLSLFVLLLISTIVLRSIAPSIYPLYFVYFIIAVVAFIFFSQLDFDIISLFSKHLYIGSIVLLLVTLIIGKVTRGVIRWIPIGALTIQSAELVRPFLLLYYANQLTKDRLTANRLIRIIIMFLIPFGLILIQPSLGVAILFLAGFIGVLLSSGIKKSYFLWLVLFAIIFVPVSWQFLKPYQKARIITFVDPFKDPLGRGYNAIQSIISVGSGRFFGRGLGKGVQTQLAFLPERQTDFIFAAISEELGFVGAGMVLSGLFLILWRLTVFMERAISPAARAYLAGFFLMLFFQALIHIGMNMGLLPITGVPLPLISAGGSSLLATMIGLGIALGARKS